MMIRLQYLKQGMVDFEGVCCLRGVSFINSGEHGNRDRIGLHMGYYGALRNVDTI